MLSKCWLFCRRQHNFYFFYWPKNHERPPLFTSPVKLNERFDLSSSLILEPRQRFHILFWRRSNAEIYFAGFWMLLHHWWEPWECSAWVPMQYVTVVENVLRIYLRKLLGLDFTGTQTKFSIPIFFYVRQRSRPAILLT